MKIKIERSSLLDTLVYASLFLYLASNLIAVSFYSAFLPSSLLNAAVLIAVLLMLFHEFLGNKFNSRTLFGLAYFLILIGLIWESSRTFNYYIFTLVLIFLLRDFPFEKLVKFVLPVVTCLLIFIILSSKIGVIPNYIEISSTRVRHYLGFRYSLFPSTIMLNITAMALYIKKDKILKREWIALLVSVLWIYLQTDSRLTALSSITLLVLGLVVKFVPDFLYKIRYFLLILIPSYVYGFVLSLTIAKSYIFAGSVLKSLDRFLGGRVYLASKSLSLYEYGWLGKNIRWVGNGLGSDGKKSSGTYLYVDNMYIQILQKYGFLFLALFILLITVALVILYIRKEYLVFLILVLFAFHFTIDDLMMNLYYNIFLVLIALPFSARISLKDNYESKLEI